jgi:hypothetical protein
MQEFKVAYENQTGQFRKKRFELCVPIAIPSDANALAKQLKEIVVKEATAPQETGKKKGLGKKKSAASNEGKIQLSSLGMIAAATLLAAITRE